ncbi:MAG: hypothetical protein C6W57_05280 [Caldibacillus debilis]|nr:MAG: hypothetical protein C6W57_05280 [Caldibacillus debilis]
MEIPSAFHFFVRRVRGCGMGPIGNVLRGEGSASPLFVFLPKPKKEKCSGGPVRPAFLFAWPADGTGGFEDENKKLL